jgi:dephospho-CoA kinase
MRKVGEDQPDAVAICEAALLIEAGGLPRYDRLIVVTCTLEQKVGRFAERSGMSAMEARAEVVRRMAAQMPEADKVKMADFVIDNSGSKEATERRVVQIWEKLAVRS